MSHHHRGSAFSDEEETKNRLAIAFTIGAVFLMGVGLIILGLTS